MNVILCEDIDNLGDMGETVKVASGYARNFLFPRRLAVEADSASAKQIEHEMSIIRRREEKRRAELRKIMNDLSGVVLEFEMRAGEGDKLYGSVTSAHIAEKLKEEGYDISRRSLQLSEPIKSLGTHEVTVKLPGKITGEIKVVVKRTEEEAAPEAAEEEFHDFEETDSMADAEIRSGRQSVKAAKKAAAAAPAEAETAEATEDAEATEASEASEATEES